MSLASPTAHHLHVWLHYASPYTLTETCCHCFSRAEQDPLPPWVHPHHAGIGLLGLPWKTKWSPRLFLPSVNPLDIILISILVECGSSSLLSPSCVLQVWIFIVMLSPNRLSSFWGNSTFFLLLISVIVVGVAAVTEVISTALSLV